MLCSHNSEGGIILGSMCGATTARRINLAYPSWARGLLLSQGTPLDVIVAGISDRSENDRRIFARRFLTNAHETCHYHQILSTISGLQSIETSFLIHDLRKELINISIRQDASLMLPFSFDLNNSQIANQIQHSLWEIQYLIRGGICLNCQSHLLEDPISLLGLQDVDNMVVIPTKLPYMMLLASWDGEKPEHLLGATQFLECISLTYERALASLLLEPFEGERKRYTAERRGFDYHFVEDTLDNVLEYDFERPSVGYGSFIYRIAYLCCMATSKTPSRETSLNFAPLKFARIVSELNKNPNLVAQERGLEELEDVLEYKYGYATTNDARASLFENAKLRLAEVSSAITNYNDNSIRVKSPAEDFYDRQINILSRTADPIGDLITYLGENDSLPRPPFSIVYSDGGKPIKFLYSSNPVNNLGWIGYCFTWSIVSQFFTSKCIRCPLKVEGIYCHKSDSSCGSVPTLSDFKNVRNCYFERAIENILNMDQLRDRGDVVELDSEQARFLLELMQASVDLAEST